MNGKEALDDWKAHARGLDRLLAEERTRAESAEARLKQAVEVMRPFAEAADGAMDEFDGDDSAIWEHPIAQNVKIKLFRAARQFIREVDNA